MVYAVSQSLSCIQVFATPWTAAYQASLPFSVSWSLLKPISVELMMPSNHLILCRPLLLLPPIRPSMRVFFSESALHIRWPKYWSFSFSTSFPMNIQGWFPLGLTGLISLLSKGLSKVFSNTTVQKHQFFSTQSSCFPCGSVGKESACNAGDLGSIPGLGRSPGEGKRYPLQYSGLENSMDYTVLCTAKSQTRLSDFHFPFVLQGVQFLILLLSVFLFLYFRCFLKMSYRLIFIIQFDNIVL